MSDVLTIGRFYRCPIFDVHIGRSLLFGLEMCKYSKLKLKTFAHSLLLHSGRLAHTQQRAANAMLQQRARESIQLEF